MNPLRRAKAMLADPFAEWALIERESGDPAYLLSRYVAVLALVPAVFGFIGRKRRRRGRAGHRSGACEPV